MRIAPPDLLHTRCAAVRSALASRQLDALLITSLPNIAYLTGFFASAAAAVVSPHRVSLVGDGRYAESLAERARACPFLDVHQLKPPSGYDETIVQQVLVNAPLRIGFEAAHLSVSRYTYLTETALRAGVTARFVPTDSMVEKFRMAKDDWEIDLIKEAAGRVSDVAKCILPNVLAGKVEADIAEAIERELRRAGFQRPAFDTIVASGPNAAKPHARAGQRRIEDGDLVVLDFGGVLDGYCTDLTRTVIAGTPGKQESRVIEQVVEAQHAAFAVIRPGVAPEDVDRAARGVLAGHGMGDAITHGTGHGLGLEVHEAPRISIARPDQAEPPLAAGMVLTLEPGVYFAGWGGVRIEDDVLVTATGAEWLTDVPRFFHDGS